MTLRPDPIASILVFGCALIGGNATARAWPYSPPPVPTAQGGGCSSCRTNGDAPKTSADVARELGPAPISLVRAESGADEVILGLGRPEQNVLADVRAAIVVVERQGQSPRVEVAARDGDFWWSRLGDLLIGGRGRLIQTENPPTGSGPFAVYRRDGNTFRFVTSDTGEVLPNVAFRATRSLPPHSLRAKEAGR